MIYLRLDFGGEKENIFPSIVIGEFEAVFGTP